MMINKLRRKNRCFLVVFQQVINDLRAKFSLNEVCPLVKICEDDLLKSKSIWCLLKDFSLLSPLKQVRKGKINIFRSKSRSPTQNSCFLKTSHFLIISFSLIQLQN